MSRPVTSTERGELVETHNLYLCFKRLQSVPNQWNEEAARRALYHAVCMASLLNTTEKTELRIALKLP